MTTQSKRAAVFASGTTAVELDPVTTSREHDLLIEKTLPSAFAEADLTGWLRERGVDTPTVRGFTSNNCGKSTVRDAVRSGFRVEFLADAAGAFAHANRAGASIAEES
ncbi:isochorismatase family protein [Paraburkholderia lacunae]|uniref:Isochorismatase-like domain-containing protein n=1 Tax=Paraburkholderia lacunae TaxID=2211104 RepID=A0A370NAV6_9BURK|nr:isochorismatase family protein [Paraburkholderia lacunae]RDK02750.1 hypothetical protein DLM46_10890 [Paraburkholderia lacunae]